MQNVVPYCRPLSSLDRTGKINLGILSTFLPTGLETEMPDLAVFSYFNKQIIKTTVYHFIFIPPPNRRSFVTILLRQVQRLR
jgi:hypothetical protein